jgi:hypothetical protein
MKIIIISINLHAKLNNNNNTFLYLRAELNSQWPIADSARIQTTAISQPKTTKETLILKSKALEAYRVVRC